MSKPSVEGFFMDKISQNKQKKIEAVGILEEKVKRAKAVVLTDYRGLKHQQLEGLKKALKAVEAELVVSKNTLLSRALANSEVSSSLAGPTATLFAYNDVIAPLKELAKIIKLLKMPTIKLGIFEGRLISAGDVLKLAALPSREVLIAQVVGGMKAPLYGLHRALSWNLQKLVMTLKAIENKKTII